MSTHAETIGRARAYAALARQAGQAVDDARRDYATLRDLCARFDIDGTAALEHVESIVWEATQQYLESCHVAQLAYAATEYDWERP